MAHSSVEAGAAILSLGAVQWSSRMDWAKGCSRNGRPSRARLGPRSSLFDRAEQQICNKGLVQKGNATRTLSLHSRSFVVKGSHENDRKLAAQGRQMAPQVDSGHATKMDVDEQAIDVCRSIEVEKRLGGSKDFGGKSICAQKTLDALEHARIVVHHRYHLRRRHDNPELGADDGVLDRRAASAEQPYPTNHSTGSLYQSTMVS